MALLSQKMSKELHDFKEMTTGTLLFSNCWIRVPAPEKSPVFGVLRDIQYLAHNLDCTVFFSMC